MRCGECAAVRFPWPGGCLAAGQVRTLLAVALFAVSEPPIRYAAEVKPYSADLLVSLLLLSLAVKWLQNPGRVRQLWILAAMMPLVTGISLPSVFLIGSIVAVGLYEVLARREIKLTNAFGGLLAAAGSSVALMATLGQYHASPADRDYLIRFLEGRVPTLLARPDGTGRLAASSPHGAVICISPRREPADLADDPDLRLLRRRDRIAGAAQP